MEQIFFLVLFIFFVLSHFFVFKSYQNSIQLRKAIYLNVFGLWISFVFDFLVRNWSSNILITANTIDLVKQGQFLLIMQACYLLLKLAKKT